MSDAKNDGGPAYPVPTDMSGGEAFYLATPGMSLRDWFAGQALIAIGDINPHLPGDKADPNIWPEPAQLVARRAKLAYLQADAMLEARK